MIGIVFIFLIPMVMIVGLIGFFGKKKIFRNLWELAAALTPILTWYLLLTLHNGPKNLGNASIEPLILGILTGFAQLQLIFQPKVKGSRTIAVIINILLINTLPPVIYFAMPIVLD